jgi:choline dehydrogenase
MSNRKPRLCGSFDYIIVGAGSAGCVLANRLSESPGTRVLLLEAGPEDSSPWIHVPLGYGRLFRNSALNWMYTSVPQRQLHDRKIFQPRGKVIGGSSSINGLVYIRGQSQDFDHWRDLGNPGWGWSDVLPYFIRSERQIRGASAFHGASGPMTISDHSEPHTLCDAFLAGAAQAGYAVNNDFNGASQEGAGYYQTTSDRGRRVSSGVAYLRPVRGRHNLTVTTNAHVTRVVLEQNRAAGVEWSKNGECCQASASAEVILSAGSINTPQILQLSGLGPAELLVKHGIPVAANLPGVGANLQDHLQIRCIYECKQRITFNDDMRNPIRMMNVMLRYLLHRKGPLTVSAGYAGGFFRSGPELATPDLQLYFITFSTDRMGEKLHPFSGFTISTCQLRPQSRGSVRISSCDPFAAPSIDPNYLASPLDLHTNVAGVKLIRQIAGTNALNQFIRKEVTPGSDFVDDSSIESYCRDTGSSLYHPTGTARMGTDGQAVVDSRLRVHGIAQLRVVDGSIMPTLVSGNTHAGVVMIAEKGASMILQDARSVELRSQPREINSAPI